MSHTSVKEHFHKHPNLETIASHLDTHTQRWHQDEPDQAARHGLRQSRTVTSYPMFIPIENALSGEIAYRLARLRAS